MTYNAAGQVKAINYNDGALSTQYGYYGYQAFVMGDHDDAPPNWGARDFGRLWRIHSYASSPYTDLQDLQYDYDPVSNVTGINDVKNGEEVSFSYDTLDRLTGASGAYTTTYTYGAIGNLLSKTGVGAYTYDAQAGDCPEGPLTKVHAVVTAGNNAYCYDQNGNLRRRQMGGTTYTLTYDAENRLTSISGGLTASFTYDGNGARVKRTMDGVTTVYIGDYYESPGGTKYYYLGGRRVALRQGGTVRFLLGDHLGSTRVTADSNGNRVGELWYWPYGNTRLTWGSTPTDRQYTGQVFDSNPSLYYYGARYYDVLVGRFISPDPIVPEPGNPQDLNRYAYTRNNPLRYTDPSGMFTEDELRRWDISDELIARWKQDFAWWEVIKAARLGDIVQALGRYVGQAGLWRGMFGLQPLVGEQVHLFIATLEDRGLWGTREWGRLSPEEFRQNTREGRTLWRQDEQAGIYRQVPTAETFLVPDIPVVRAGEPDLWSLMREPLGEGAARLRQVTGRFDPFTPTELTGAPLGYNDILASGVETAAYVGAYRQLAGRGPQVAMIVSMGSLAYNFVYDNVTQSGPYYLGQYFP